MQTYIAKKSVLTDIFDAARSAVHPVDSVRRVLTRQNNRLSAGGAVYDLDVLNKVVVIGAGQAAGHMAAAVEAVLGDVISSGTVVVPYGCRAASCVIEQTEADHAIPDKAGLQATRKILDMLRGVDAGTLVVCLLSAGASSLLVDPLPGVTLEDKQRSTDLLLRAGASCFELNTVLKHLSGVKGGRLARAAYPATVLTLSLSDVLGDRMDMIASGPMAPGNATFCEAARVIGKYGLRYKLPEQVTAFIERGTRGQEPETAKSAEICFLRTRNTIVGGTAQALFAAGNKARESGYLTELAIAEDRDPAHRTARVLAKKALRVRDSLKYGEQRCLLFCGENPAAKPRSGKGGRNRELALAFAREIAGIPGITLLSAGTDGPWERTGAVVDGTTIPDARAQGLHVQAFLDDKDTAAFFKKLGPAADGRNGGAAGPDGINTMNVQVILVES